MLSLEQVGKNRLDRGLSHKHE